MQIHNIRTGSIDLMGLITSTKDNSKSGNSRSSLSFDKVLQGSKEKRNFTNSFLSASDKKADASVNAAKEYYAAKNDCSKNMAEHKELGTKESSTKAGSIGEAETTGKSETIGKAAEEIKETLMDTLSISEEELMELMSILNLSMIDLLNPDNLKQLVLANAGASDAAVLLTEEGLNQSLNQLLQRLDQILSEQGLTEEEVDLFKTIENESITLLDMPGGTISSAEEEFNTAAQTKENSDIREESNEERTIKFDFEAVRHTQESGKEQNTKNQRDHQPQGSEVTPAEQFLNQLAQTAATRTEFSNEISNIQEIRTITSQIVEQIKVVVKPAQTSMEMMLNPEHLGKVALNITSKEGILTASFITQTQAAKEAIESQIQVLKENLEAQGLKVEAVEVTVSNFGFDQSGQMEGQNSKNEQGKEKSSRPLRMDGLEEDGAEEESDNAADAWSDSSFDTSA